MAEVIHEKIIQDLATQRQILTSILEQTTKTNGRVTKLEDRVNGFDVALALERNDKKHADWWKNKLGSAVIGMVCAALGFTALLLLQKTHIIDISVVSSETYDSISQTLSE